MIYFKNSVFVAFGTAVFAVFNIMPLSAKTDNILIFAASSLAPVLTNIKSSFQNMPNFHVKFSFGSSSSLARQIVRGAPADIFISANAAWMDYAEHKMAIVPSSRKSLFSNRIVLVAHQSVQLKLSTLTPKILNTLLNDRPLSLADPSHVPAGIYGKQALEALGLWRIVKERLAPAMNVRAALALVERNEAQIGLLYQTDALHSQKVKIIFTFPENTHENVNYVISIIQGKTRPAVEMVFNVLLGAKAKSIFSKYGFEIF